VNYGGSYSRDSRISFSSILLLVIFVSAAALIATAIIWRPWSSEETSAVQVQPTVTVAADAVQQAPTDTPIPAQGP
jgi:hypothetical protein